MYRIIGYHGIGKREVASDLRLLWDNFCNFAKHRRIRHIYCSQVLNDKKGADVLLIIQYDSEVMSRREDFRDITSKPHERIDYWFYVRE